MSSEVLSDTILLNKELYAKSIQLIAVFVFHIIHSY